MKEYDESMKANLLKLHLQGLTTRQIAVELGISASGVSRNLVRFRKSGRLVEPERTSSGHSSPLNGSLEDADASTSAKSPKQEAVAANPGADAASVTVAVKHNPPRSARKAIALGERSQSSTPADAAVGSPINGKDVDTAAKDVTNPGPSTRAPPPPATTVSSSSSSTSTRKRSKTDDEPASMPPGKRMRGDRDRASTGKPLSSSSSRTKNDSASNDGSVSNASSSQPAPAAGVERITVRVEVSREQSNVNGVESGSESGADISDKDSSSDKVPSKAASSVDSASYQQPVGKKKWRKGELCWAGWLVNPVSSPAHPSSGSSGASDAGSIQLMYRCQFRGRYHPSQIVGLKDPRAQTNGVLEEKENAHGSAAPAAAAVDGQVASA